EDGIRDFHVTGVQTCALPIFEIPRNPFEHRITPVTPCGSAQRCSSGIAPCFHRVPAQATWHAAPPNGENPCARAGPPHTERRDRDRKSVGEGKKVDAGCQKSA